MSAVKSNLQVLTDGSSKIMQIKNTNALLI